MKIITKSSAAAVLRFKTFFINKAASVLSPDYFLPVNSLSNFASAVSKFFLYSFISAFARDCASAILEEKSYIPFIDSYAGFPIIEYSTDSNPGTDFSEDFSSKILYGGVGAEDVSILSEPTGINLAKLAVLNADGVIFGSSDIPEELMSFCRQSGLPLLPYKEDSLKDGSFVDDYNNFYDLV